MSNYIDPFRGGAVPIPNRLFDHVLPALTDTELRVLLIVLRQVWGWREGTDSGGWRYKERDWLSHRQLQYRTGRGSEAVSRAVQGLVSRDLIAVESATGNALSSSEARRAFVGRLYFRPGDLWKSSEISRPAFSGRTTYRRVNNMSKFTPKKPQRSSRQVTGAGWQRALPQ